MNKTINDLSARLYQKRNKNKDFTLIARDCIGGLVYHQFKLRFLSPTINLFFEPADFNEFCLNLKNYIDCEMTELKGSNIEYPVGVISPKNMKPIKVHFMHYESFIEAHNKWEERKKRINWNNIYVVSSFCYPGEIKTYSEELVSDWNKIPYKKVVFTDKHYGFDNEFIIEKPEECEEYAWLLFTPGKKITWKRTFNKFNFIKFLKK